MLTFGWSCWDKVRNEEPKKAVYNKVCNKTTFDIFKVIKTLLYHTKGFQLVYNYQKINKNTALETPEAVSLLES